MLWTKIPVCVLLSNTCRRSLYSSLTATKPLLFLHLTLPPGSFDVNVTPDKRAVFVQKESAIITAVVQVRV